MKKLLIAFLATVFILSGCGMEGLQDVGETSRQVNERPNAKTYVVGTDIEAGDYYFVSDIPLEANGEELMAASIMLTKSLTINSESDEAKYVIVEDIVANTYYLNIGKDDGYLILTNATLYPASEHPKIVKNDDGSYPPGDYKVGVDIPAGNYSVSPIDGIDEYTFYIAKDAKHQESSAISYYTITHGDPQNVTLEDGQYLYGALMNITPK